MSLARRLFFSFSLLMCGVLIVNTWLHFKSSEQYLDQQLSSLAQDTATSLALTISHASNESDHATSQAMVNVIFDRGYYASILYSDTQGNVLASRSLGINVKGVPSWFADWAQLPMHIGRADVISGWQQLGEISVVVDPSYSYQDLWRNFKNQAWLCLFAIVLLYFLVSQLVKYILKPLSEVERQAQALIDKQFIVQSTLPSTPELRRVVDAMNSMVVKVREMFSMQVDTISDLRVNVATDKLTGLMNKIEFDACVNAWLKTDAASGGGTLMLIRAHNLKAMNDTLGLDATDQWLCEIASHLQKVTQSTEKKFLARRAGGDFSLFLPGCDYGYAQQTCDNILNFPLIQPDTQSERALHIGAMAFCNGVKLTQMLSAVDASLRLAQEQAGSHAYIDIYDSQTVMLSAKDWREKLLGILQNESLFFLTQGVLKANGSGILYAEVLARIKYDETVITAGVFWPLVERFGLQVEFDRLVLKQVVHYLDKITKHSAPLGVNLSCASIQNESFLAWMQQSVLRSPHADRLVFEVPEVVLSDQNDQFQRFISAIKESGARLTLSGFGILPSSLGCLQTVPFDYVKVDSRFVVDIDKNSQNQFYLKNLVNITKSCDIKMIAHGIETNSQWEVLKVFDVYAGQGYYIDNPHAPD